MQEVVHRIAGEARAPKRFRRDQDLEWIFQPPERGRVRVLAAIDDYVAPKRKVIDHSSDDGSMSPLAVIVIPAKRSE